MVVQLTYLTGERLDPKRCSVEDFLYHCLNGEVKSIRVVIRDSQSDSLENLTQVPFYITYSGLDESQDVEKVRSAELITSLCFEKSDQKFADPIWGISEQRSPWLSLVDYGIKCAKYCAQHGFPTNLRIFVSCNSSKNHWGTFEPKQVKKEPKVEISSLTFLL